MCAYVKMSLFHVLIEKMQLQGRRNEFYNRVPDPGVLSTSWLIDCVTSSAT